MILFAPFHREEFLFAPFHRGKEITNQKRNLEPSEILKRDTSTTLGWKKFVPLAARRGSMFPRRVRLALNVTYSGWHQQCFYSLRVVPVVRLLCAARPRRILLLCVGYTHRTVASCRWYPPHSAAQLQPTPAASYYHWRVVAKSLYSSIWIYS